MADAEGGGSKVVRGLGIAVLVAAAIVLLVVFWRQFLDLLGSIGTYIQDHIPADNSQKAAVLVYLIVAVLLSIVFSKAGHFTAYGIVMGLGPLLWFLFWEGFPPLGLKSSWTSGMGVGHMPPNEVILWAIVADVLITLVFVPLELREKFQRRRHRLGAEPE
jgi:hypothetical protein